MVRAGVHFERKSPLSFQSEYFYKPALDVKAALRLLSGVSLLRGTSWVVPRLMIVPGHIFAQVFFVLNVRQLSELLE